MNLNDIEKPAFPGSTTTVLVIDDEQEMLEVTVSILQQHPKCKTVACVHAIEAMEMIRTLKPNLIICDLLMPFKNGIDILDQTRTEGILTPFIMTTGDLSDNFKDKIAVHTNTDLLNKPFSIKAFVELVQLRLHPVLSL